ncbi:hypothetical protein EWM64_g6433 [Hericium alpestre]|uniref:Uncharacterized protein n=1 Tax=Hericium alpestre TaxID=135208 RepID=A0A4Y9ZVS0_9AGAM|nr:hypothetical protein EWM64_g6433 [Hericium alpestre]
MTAAHSSGSQLTVSRIHRLLRPLRNKCANLASLSTSTSGSAIITYASRANSTAWRDDLPPLETIPRPRVILMRLDLRTKYQAKLALSQKVWDVLDTFENILQAAFGRKVPEGQAGRMLTLTEMCAAVVGENLQDEIAREEEDCEDRDGGEGEAGLAVVNELYEAVPEDLRKWTLVTHAITIILEICPHHPTLLVSLLTQTMKRSLARDSQTLLYALVSVAIGARRSSIYPTPICHPSHASYLQDLSETWTATGSAYFSQRTFIHILADVLCETESPHVWKCKALSRCTRSIRSTDFPAFLYTVDTLIEVIGRIRSRRRTPRGKSPRSKAAPREHEELRVRLTKWFRSISDHPAFDLDTTDASTEEYQAIVSSVVRARHWGIHLCSADGDTSTDPTTIELPSALVCLAVQCLSAPLFATLGPADVASNLKRYYPAETVAQLLPLYGELPEDAPADACARRFGEELSDGQIYLPVRLLHRDLLAHGFPAFRYEIRWAPEQVRARVKGYVTHGMDRPLWAMRLPVLEEPQVQIARAWLVAVADEVQALERDGRSGHGMREMLTLEEGGKIKWAEDTRWDELMRLRHVFPGEDEIPGASG